MQNSNAVTRRVTKSSRAARPVRHHKGERAGGVKEYDALIVQLGDEFLAHWQTAQTADVGMAEAVATVGAALSLEHDVGTEDGSNSAIKMCESFLQYVSESAPFGKLAESSQKVERSRMRRIILAVAFGHVAPEDLPVDRGMRACYEAAKAAQRVNGAGAAQGRKAKVENAENAEQAPTMPLNEIESAMLAVADALSSVKDGKRLAAFAKAHPMVAIAALRDALHDTLAPEGAPKTAPEGVLAE